MDKALMKARTKEYIKSHATECPYCYSTNIQSTGEYGVADMKAFNEVKCKACRKKFREIYKLKSIEEV